MGGVNRRRALVAILAYAAMAAHGTLHAQARGPAAREVRNSESKVEQQPVVLDEAARATKIAEMETWLRRLVGVFRVDGKYAVADHINKVHGTAICRGIGDGPGVQCFIGPLSWEPISAFLARRGSKSFENGALPVMSLGINPVTLEIQQVLAGATDVWVRSGTLVGDAVDFSEDIWKNCNRVPVSVCWVGSKISAKPADEIVMKFVEDDRYEGKLGTSSVLPGHSSAWELHLHREVPADTEEARNSP